MSKRKCENCGILIHDERAAKFKLDLFPDKIYNWPWCIECHFNICEKLSYGDSIACDIIDLSNDEFELVILERSSKAC